MKKYVSLIAVIIIIAICLSSCLIFFRPERYNSTHSNQKGVQSDQLTKNNHYPVTIQNYNYAKEPIDITFEKAPEKVLAVYQNSIEILLALGLEDRIIAAAGLDHPVKPEFEEAFAKIEYIGRMPDKETVIMLQPDFILSWFSYFGPTRLGEVDYWHERGTNTYMMMNSFYMLANSGAGVEIKLENEYTNILNMGKIFDVEEKAQKLVNEMKAEVEKATIYATAEKKDQRVLIIEFTNPGWHVYRSSSLAGDMAIKIGANLIDTEGSSIGAEDLVTYNPDVLFIVYYMEDGSAGSVEEIVSRITDDPQYASVSAVRTGRVHPVMLGEVYCSGVRTYDGIVTLAKGLYPKMYK